MDNWNTDDQEIKKNIIKIFESTLQNRELKISELSSILKKKWKNTGIIIEKNGKKRNINNYIKVKYGSMTNLLISLNHIFHTKGNDIKISNNYLNESKDYIFI